MHAYYYHHHPVFHISSVFHPFHSQNLVPLYLHYTSREDDMFTTKLIYFLTITHHTTKYYQLCQLVLIMQHFACQFK